MRHVRDALVAALALFALANLALGLVAPALDANWLWLGWAEGRSLSALLGLGLFGVGTMAWCLLPAPARIVARLLALTVAGFAGFDVVGYYQAVQTGIVSTSFPVPLSVVISGLLVSWAIWPPREPHLRTWVRFSARGAAFGLWITAIVATLATTDYARPADVIVVFGARVYSSGRPSDALADRTRTACDLYKRGLAGTILMSGGKSAEAPISEPEAMRRFAIGHGVPAGAIVLDEHGVNTRATIENTVVLGQKYKWRSVLMVSHDYHLARIKLASQRAGLTVYTVPAVESRTLLKKPYFFARELAAWAWYWAYPR